MWAKGLHNNYSQLFNNLPGEENINNHQQSVHLDKCNAAEKLKAEYITNTVRIRDERYRVYRVKSLCDVLDKHDATPRHFNRTAKSPDLNPMENVLDQQVYDTDSTFTWQNWPCY